MELSLKRSHCVFGLHGIVYCNVVNIGCHSLCGFLWCQELFKLMPWQATLGKFGFTKVHDKTTKSMSKIKTFKLIVNLGMFLAFFVFLVLYNFLLMPDVRICQNLSMILFLSCQDLAKKTCFTITAGVYSHSLANFYCQYSDRHMNLKFMGRISERERAIWQFVIVKKGWCQFVMRLSCYW